MPRRRTERVAALLMRELATMIENGLKDPRIGFVTVTGVEISDDLRHARVFVVTRGSDEERARTIGALGDAAPHMRYRLGRLLDLRYVPTLCFEVDRSFDHAERIEKLLDEIRGEGEPE